MNMAAPLAVFRADAGATIGWGHVMRCAALAHVLRDSGWRCAWATLSDNAAMTTRLAAHFDEFIDLVPDQDLAPDQFEPRQMQAHWPDGCRLLVVDHYQRDAAYASSCRGWADRILAIDDLAERAHDCDLLLDMAPNCDETKYRARVLDDATLLLGPAYALLRPEFATTRRRILPRRYDGAARRILLALGATNPKGILDTVLDAIEQASVDLAPDLILAWNTPDKDRLAARVALAGGQIHIDVDNMAELMAAADLAVGAGGMSSWERCSLGLPTLLLVIADNQMANAKALSALGAAQTVTADTASLVGAINALAGDGDALKSMSQAASRLSDGLGAVRVCQAVGPVPQARDGQPVRLRPVQAADGDLILAWQRQPETRRFARNSGVPGEAEHLAWMRTKLDDPGCIMNLILHGEAPAGIVRLDRAVVGYEVSIAIDPERFRMAIGSIALALLHQLLPDEDLWAHVHDENVASRTMFRRAGYAETKKNGWLCQPARTDGVNVGSART
jgi:UDP-2,4-diacetamido-2,4,6-trideoxy-beta-L-altropyranose hydrolase